MGFVEGQQKKIRERIARIAQAELAAGETLETGLYAVEQPVWWWALLPIATVTMILGVQGYDLPAWIVGGSVGAYFAVNMKPYVVLLTDRRLIVARLSKLSQKRWRPEHDAPRENVRLLRERKRLLTRRVDLEGAGRRLRLTIGKPWAEEAERLVGSLSSTLGTGPAAR